MIEILENMIPTIDTERLRLRGWQERDFPAYAAYRADAASQTYLGDVMTRDPQTATPDELGAAAASRMEAHGIMALPVVDADGRLEGMVHLHDLMRAGAV